MRKEDALSYADGMCSHDAKMLYNTLPCNVVADHMILSQHCRILSVVAYPSMLTQRTIPPVFTNHISQKSGNICNRIPSSNLALLSPFSSVL